MKQSNQISIIKEIKIFYINIFLYIFSLLTVKIKDFPIVKNPEAVIDFAFRVVINVENLEK